LGQKELLSSVGENIQYNDRLEGTKCSLRVPTGGGKTLLASHSIPLFSKLCKYGYTYCFVACSNGYDSSADTCSCISADVTHPYRQALQSYYGDKLKICDIESLQTLNKHDVNQSCIVIVTTIQIFNIDKEKTFQRNAYAFDESLSEHFTGLTDFQTQNMDRVTADTLQYQPFLIEKDIGRVNIRW
jgi:type III restriction enzyme